MAYQQQCSKVGNYGYASNFYLYVFLSNRNGNPDTNKSLVDYNVYCQSNGSGSLNSKTRRYFSINNQTVVDITDNISASSPNAYIHIASGTVEVYHNDDGTKIIPFTALIQSATYGVSAYISDYFTLYTIPRASAVSCSTANIEETATVFISSASNSFTHNVTATFGSLSVDLLNNVRGGAYSWIIPSSFYSQIPNSKTGSGIIRCNTYNGSTFIGTKEFTFNVGTNEEKCKPSVDGNIVDINPETIALTGNNNTLIKYKSYVEATITSTPKNNATIVQKKINGVVFSGNTVNLSNIQSNNFVVEVIDSRGYVGTLNITKDLINYIELTLNTELFRPHPTTGEVSLKYSGNFFNGSFGQEINQLEFFWKYKEKGATDFLNGGNITPTFENNKINENTVLLGDFFNYLKSYEILICAQDKLSGVVKQIIVPQGKPVFYWSENMVDINGELKVKSKSIFPKILYNNTSGYNGTITLNESVNNFKYIEIFYRSSYNHYKSVKVENPQSKVVLLDAFHVFAGRSNVMVGISKVLVCSGTSLIFYGPGTDEAGTYYSSSNTTEVTNNIFITKVIGYYE